MLQPLSTTLTSSATVIQFEPRPSNGRYLKLDHSFLDSSVWQSFDPLSSALFVEIGRCHTGFNNGEIRYSVRDGMARFRVSDRAIQRAFNQLEKSGVAVRTRRGTFDLKTKEAKATEWFIPSLASPQRPTSPLPTPQRPAGDTTTTNRPDTTTTKYIDKEESIDIDSKRSASDSIQEKADLRSLPPRQTESQQAPSPAATPSFNGHSHPAAAGEGVPRRGDVFIEYDTHDWDLVERYGRRATGKTYLRFGRLRGLWMPRADWETIRTLAQAEGAVS